MTSMILQRFVVGLVAALLLISSSLSPASDTFQAGSAKLVITPDAPMWMAGYGDRNRPADGKLTDLYARALFLQDAQGSRLLVVTLDLIGIDRSFSQSVCRQLAERHGLRREQIALCSSHTHTGPVVAGNLQSMHYRTLPATEQSRVDAYAKQLEKQILELSSQAIGQLTPCRISWGSGQATFATNRRNNPEAEVPARRVAGKLAGPQDHDVPVLAVHGLDGNLRAVLFGYACHATVLSSYQWSGDYPGYSATTLEQDFPGSVALFWAGCGGDQNPLPRRQVSLAQQYGHELAGSVKQVLENGLQPITGSINTSYREIDLPLGDQPTRDDWQRDAQSDNRYVASRARWMLEQLDAGQVIPKTYPYPIAQVQFGEQVDWVLLGGEVVVDYAVRLKTQRHGQRTWVAAYANDVMAYIPSRRVLLEGGYEGGGAMVYYGLPAPWHESVEEQIMAGVSAR